MGVPETRQRRGVRGIVHDKSPNQVSFRHKPGTRVFISGGVFHRQLGTVKECVLSGPMAGRYIVDMGALGDILVKEEAMSVR